MSVTYYMTVIEQCTSSSSKMTKICETDRINMVLCGEIVNMFVYFFNINGNHTAN